MNNLERLRLKVRPLLHFSDPADALPVYYAFYHDPRRTELFVHKDKGKHAEGFVAVCQTGQRLFQPTVVLRAKNRRVAAGLLREALVPGRPYYVVAKPGLQEAVARVVDIERFELNRIYRLEMSRFQPITNVLVVTEQALGGLPRFVIRTGEEITAEAGFNWASSHFVEVYVRTTPAAQGRGWGRAVLAASTTWAIRSARRPLYVAGEENEASIALAESSGYIDTGSRELVGEGVCRVETPDKPQGGQEHAG